MSEEQLKAFLEKVKTDTSLQEKLKAAADADDVVSIAKEVGFTISSDDLTKAQYELSDQELEDIAGGYDITHQTCNRTCGTAVCDCPPGSCGKKVKPFTF